MLTKDGEGGRGGKPKGDEGWWGGGAPRGGVCKPPKLADIICEQPLLGWSEPRWRDGDVSDAEVGFLPLNFTKHPVPVARRWLASILNTELLSSLTSLISLSSIVVITDASSNPHLHLAIVDNFECEVEIEFFGKSSGKINCKAFIPGRQIPRWRWGLEGWKKEKIAKGWGLEKMRMN